GAGGGVESPTVTPWTAGRGQGRMSHLRRTFAALGGAALVTALAIGATARPSWAQGSASPSPSATGADVVQLKGMRTWPSPSGTRVVFEFSSDVVPVAPDSGSAQP